MPAMPVMEMDDMEMDMDDHDHEVQDHSDNVPEDFKEEFTGLIEVYLDLKDALFVSDTEQAMSHTGRMKEELESIGMHRMDGDAHMKWMQQYEAIEEHLNHILEAGDLDGQRYGFAELSHILIEAVKNYEIPGVVYHQYCPMEEAHWLSTEEQIENPYAPETMPSCGEVIERIES
jgi:membrane fusion protein, copper/silver efflux system